MHPMNSAWEVAMNAARLWRNRGNDLLIIFLAVEFLLEMWPEIPSDWSPWNPPNKWLQHHSSWKRYLTIAAALMIVCGVALERYEGNKADDFADRISASLEEYIVSMLPRERLLTPAAVKRIVTGLKPFAGQRVAIIGANGDTPGEGSEIRFFQIEIADTLDKAGWLNPSGQRIMKPTGPGSEECNDCLPDTRTRGQGGTGMWANIDRHASSDTRKVAEELMKVLTENHLPTGGGDVFPLPSPFTNDQHLIVLIIDPQR
jgi:hypothetical protein